MTKRVLALALALLLLLCGCSNGTPESSAPVSGTPSSAAPDTSGTPAVHPSDAATPSPSPAPTDAPGASPEATPSAPPSDSPEATPTASPDATPDATASPVPTPSPDTQAPAPQLYSIETADTVLSVTGEVLERAYYFTLEDLQLLGGSFEADYFSRGKEPQEETNHFIGIRVDYLLDAVVGVGDSARKVSFKSSDGYGTAFSLADVRSTYINEKDADAELYMILAWSQDGEELGALRLVMGQTIEGDYNRTNWVRDVMTIEVKA